jgi:hypothetical protein
MKYSFEMALAYLKQGKIVRRAAWNHWAIRFKDGDVIIVLDYKSQWVGSSNVIGALTMRDILAEDWEVCE